MAINRIAEPPLDLVHFFSEVLANDQNVKFLFLRKGNQKYHLDYTDIKQMAAEALLRDQEGYEVYFACASFLEKKYKDTNGKTRQRTVDNAIAAGSFWLDIDCGDGKSYATRNKAVTAIKQFCAACDLPLPLLINSGGGLHAYWHMNTSVTKEDWLPIAKKLKGLTRNNAIRLYADDTRTADISSLLRPVKTHNLKPQYDSPLVKVIWDSKPLKFDDFVAKINAASSKYPEIQAAKVAPKETKCESKVTANKLREILKFISADVERGSGAIFDNGNPTAYWAGVIWGIRSEGDHHKEVAREWSQTSKRYLDGGGFEHTWDQYDPNHANPVGIGSVIRLSKHFGYRSDFNVTADIFNKQTRQTSPPVGTPWPEPKALQSALPKVPAFDLDMLPDVLVPFVKDTSERMGQPVDFFAIPSMITAAAALGSKWAVCPKALDKSWRESAVLWGGVVAKSGAKKSPCLTIATKPIQNIEQKLYQEHEMAHGIYLANKIQYDASSKNNKNGSPSGSAPIEPKRQRAIVQDATYQKVTEIMCGSPCGLLGLYDEIAGLISSWETNGQETARSFYLSAWNGNQSYFVDRVERGTSKIDPAFLCVVGGVQPSILAEYIQGAKKVGRGNDGLVQRFQLFTYPDIDTGFRDVDRPVDEMAETAAYDAIEALRSLNSTKLGFETLNGDTRAILHFASDAQQVFSKLRRKIDKRAISGKEDDIMASHLSKMSATIAKLAMLIHLLDGGTGPINMVATKKAVRWFDYLYMHAKRIYESSELGLAYTLSNKLVLSTLKEPFTVREIVRTGWSGLNDIKLIEGALEELEDAGWVRSVVPNTIQGRPTKKYNLNPAVIKK